MDLFAITKEHEFKLSGAQDSFYQIIGSMPFQDLELVQ